MEYNYKEIIDKANEGLQANNPDVFLDSCAEDVVWEILGSDRLEGKKAIADFLEPMRNSAPGRFFFRYSILENDRLASAGTMVMPNKDGQLSEMGFCDIYQFEAGKIKEMLTYVVDMSKAKKD